MSEQKNKELLDLAQELTPVQEIDGIYFKRDDLFAPFGIGNLNGGKLRQGICLLSQAKQEGYTRAITGSSLISQQSPIVAAVSKYLGMSCRVVYGGTKQSLIYRHHMPRLVSFFGGSIEIISTGRSNVLQYYAKRTQLPGEFIVEYGVNCKNPNYFAPFYEITARQVQNLPDGLENLVLDCGSGISATGILYGLKKYNKKICNVWVVGTAPNRKKKIKDRLAHISILTGADCWNVSFNYVDLFGSGIKYEDRFEAVLGDGTRLHPNYEGKVWAWLKEDLSCPMKPPRLSWRATCFWIVGSEPTFLA